jgi:hypothetical protein
MGLLPPSPFEGKLSQDTQIKHNGQHATSPHSLHMAEQATTQNPYRFTRDSRLVLQSASDESPCQSCRLAAIVERSQQAMERTNRPSLQQNPYPFPVYSAHSATSAQVARNAIEQTLSFVMVLTHTATQVPVLTRAIEHNPDRFS